MAFGLAGLTRGRKEKKSTSSTFQASLRPPTRSIDCIANLLITLAGMDCPIDCIANLLITLADMTLSPLASKRIYGKVQRWKFKKRVSKARIE